MSTAFNQSVNRTAFTLRFKASGYLGVICYSERPMKIVSASEAVEKLLREDPLRDYFTWWDRVKQSDVEALQNALDNATREEDIQGGCRS